MLSALLVVMVVGAISFRVLEDARSRVSGRQTVVAMFCGLTGDRPEAWAALCLLVVVPFLPLYLVARSTEYASVLLARLLASCHSAAAARTFLNESPERNRGAPRCSGAVGRTVP